MTGTRAPLGYFWGDDGYALDAAAEELGRRAAAPDGPAPRRWRVRGDATTVEVLAERVGTATLFGEGVLAVVEGPAPLVQSRANRDALLATLGAVAPGNALAFIEVTGERRPDRRATALRELESAVAAAGGEVRQLVAPAEGQMARWILERASERDISLEPAAAELLARKVGAFVREGDVDRSGQGRLAVAELEKLGLYRDGQPVRRDDVELLVPDAIPGSLWGLADAVGGRRTREAATLLERVLATRPEPVVLTVLHRRVRELILVAEARARGEPLPAIAREMKLKEYPARKLWEQAASWRPEELEAALEGLLELDGALKGEGGTSARRRRLAFDLWIADHVARQA
ncbi:MAG: polymerase delta subunit [Chloroflexi bacterium]|nr:polymerase delta subunit [Chloroflexota bacterium]